MITTVAVAPDGSLVFTGAFGIDLSIAGGPTLTATEYAMFVATLDAGGDHVASRAYAAKFAEAASDVAVASNGRIVLAGTHETGVDFGGGPSPARHARARRAPTSSSPRSTPTTRSGAASSHGDDVENQSAMGIALDGTGAQLLAGFYRGTLDLGVGIVTVRRPARRLRRPAARAALIT